jgi:hypothetical protein
MKPQTRPFTVETRGRRGQAACPARWTSLIDEVPSREIRDDAGLSKRYQTPFEAAFSPFAATATSLAEIAANVFAPKQQEPDGKKRTGRILPSLVPANRFEQVAEPVTVKPPAKRARRVSARKPGSASTPEADLSVPSPKPPVRAEVTAAVHALRKLRGRRRDRRVPAGERWKRRRLPKACW